MIDVGRNCTSSPVLYRSNVCAPARMVLNFVPNHIHVATVSVKLRIRCVCPGGFGHGGHIEPYL